MQASHRCPPASAASTTGQTPLVVALGSAGSPTRSHPAAAAADREARGEGQQKKLNQPHSSRGGGVGMKAAEVAGHERGGPARSVQGLAAYDEVSRQSHDKKCFAPGETFRMDSLNSRFSD